MEATSQFLYFHHLLYTHASQPLQSPLVYHWLIFNHAPSPQQNNQLQTESYHKRNRNRSSSKQPVVVTAADDSTDLNAAGSLSSYAADFVFRSAKCQSKERRCRIAEAQIANSSSNSAPARSKRHSNDEDDDDRGGNSEQGGAQNGSSEAKKVKQKKPKGKVVEAASKITADDLASGGRQWRGS